MEQIDLDSKRYMDLEEAARRWGLKDSSAIRHRLVRGNFPKGAARKFGTSWVVTEQCMNDLYGDEKREP